MYALELCFYPSVAPIISSSDIRAANTADRDKSTKQRKTTEKAKPCAVLANNYVPLHAKMSKYQQVYIISNENF